MSKLHSCLDGYQFSAGQRWERGRLAVLRRDSGVLVGARTATDKGAARAKIQSGSWPEFPERFLPHLRTSLAPYHHRAIISFQMQLDQAS